MGISDDIKPKRPTVEEKSVAAEIKPVEVPEIDVPEDSVEIPIDKQGKEEPVLDDLTTESKPFDRLRRETERQDNLSSTEPPHKPDAVDETEPKSSDRQDSFKTFAEYHERQPKKSHLLTIIIILFVALLGVLLILQNLDQIKEMIGIKKEAPAATNGTSSNVGVEVIENSDEDATANTPSLNATTADNDGSGTETPATTTPSTTTTPTAPAAAPTPTAAAPSTLSVKVLNGNGIAGSAASVKSALVAAGYSIGAVSNAARFTYAKTEIYFNTGKQAEAEALAAVLSSRQTEVTLNASVAGTFDLVVVVGKN